MKKSSFVALVLGTVSIVLFSLGVCMALIPEWNTFKQIFLMNAMTGAVVCLFVLILNLSIIIKTKRKELKQWQNLNL